MTNYNEPAGVPVSGPVIRSGGPAPIFSTFSILAVVCALLALFNVVGHSFVLAVVAIVLGLLGMLEAVLPSRRGGIVSLFAVGVGLLAVVIAIARIGFQHA